MTPRDARESHLLSLRLDDIIENAFLLAISRNENVYPQKVIMINSRCRGSAHPL
jgi:hypothetical protein